MKILVCGGREFTERHVVFKFLNDFRDFNGEVTTVVTGGAKGADDLAEQWAHWNEINVKVYPAKWKQFPKAAGPIRNREMLMDNPDIAYVIAFPGGRGTNNMIEQAKAGKFKVVEVT